MRERERACLQLTWLVLTDLSLKAMLSLSFIPSFLCVCQMVDSSIETQIPHKDWLFVVPLGGENQ